MEQQAIVNQWPAHLPPIGCGAPPNPLRDVERFRHKTHEEQAERMRAEKTKSTVRPQPRGNTLTRECFICGAWFNCRHREVELVELWRREVDS